jgi:serine protease Do
MRQALKTLSVFVLTAALLAPVTLMAQKEKEEKDTKEKKVLDQYIITRKGKSDDKVVIEIKGDKITVNGKSIEDNKDGDITVRKVKELSALRTPRSGSWTINSNGNNDFQFLSSDSNHAMLGVSTEKVDNGVSIEGITKESAAEKAGLKEGDVITKVDEKKIETPDDLSEAVRNHKPGDKITVTFLRENKEQKVTAELSRWKGMGVYNYGPGDNFKVTMDNLNFNNIMPKLQATPRMNWSWSGGGPKLGLSVQDTDDGKGVKVIEVDEDSNAAKAGVKENDVITEIDGKATNSTDEISKIVRESKDKVSVMIKLQRGGKTQNIEVKMPRKIKTADL